ARLLRRAETRAGPNEPAAGPARLFWRPYLSPPRQGRQLPHPLEPGRKRSQSLEDGAPMSRRDLSQPSFVDAMVSGYGRVGGFLDRIEKAFDWSSFEALLSPIHGSALGAPGYPPLTMLKIVLL